jgi:hypothetical protein
MMEDTQFSSASHNTPGSESNCLPLITGANSKTVDNLLEPNTRKLHLFNNFVMHITTTNSSDFNDNGNIIQSKSVIITSSTCSPERMPVKTAQQHVPPFFQLSERQVKVAFKMYAHYGQRQQRRVTVFCT